MSDLPPPVELGRHVERITRRSSEVRPGFTMVNLARGWGRLKRGDEGEFASSAKNRVHWFGLESPLRTEDIDEMIAAAVAHGATGVFAWVSMAGLAGGGEERLVRAAAERVPYVRYLSFARRAAVTAPARATELMVRRLEPGEVRAALAAVSAGATAEGIEAAGRVVDRGLAEMYAAFDGDRPVANGAILMDATPPGWAYIGWAGTDAAHRGRGAQSALLAARVSRAVELGATWCVSETNTVVEISMRNLARAGFAVAAEWGVFRWRDGARG